MLGNEFYRLHPMLQKRYSIGAGSCFKGSGIMKKIQGGPKWLYPLFVMGSRWKLLFPEYGRNIPFTIVNSPRVGKTGEEQVHWERIFYFGEKKRYFNALMSFDQERQIIKDYLGEPSLLYSDLVLTVSKEGALIITSKRQRLIIGRIEIPLPKPLQGLATVTERYVEERAAYSIQVIVRNPLIGDVFSYEGEFRENNTI